MNIEEIKTKIRALIEDADAEECKALALIMDQHRREAWSRYYVLNPSLCGKCKEPIEKRSFTL